MTIGFKIKSIYERIKLRGKYSELVTDQLWPSTNDLIKLKPKNQKSLPNRPLIKYVCATL